MTVAFPSTPSHRKKSYSKKLIDTMGQRVNKHMVKNEKCLDSKLKLFSPKNFCRKNAKFLDTHRLELAG